MGGAIGGWEDVFGGASPMVAAMGLSARALIRRLHPAVAEVARPGDRAVSFGYGPAKMREAYAYLMPQAGWLNLGFYHGANLPDPAGLLDGTGKALRHVKLRQPGDLSPEVEVLLQAAIADQARRLGL
jgi:hypothetical protein